MNRAGLAIVLVAAVLGSLALVSAFVVKPTDPVTFQTSVGVGGLLLKLRPVVEVAIIISAAVVLAMMLQRRRPTF